MSTTVCTVLTLALACSNTQGPEAPEVEATKQALTPADVVSTGNGVAATRVVWVKMRERASLAQARGITNWRGRGQGVRDALTATAARSQASVRSYLSQRGARVRPFWIANVLRVEANETTIAALEQRADVESVTPDRVYSVPPIQRGNPVQAINALEWGIDSIRAAEAWGEFGIKGEGIVIANIDTGVEYTHPALAAQYRGAAGGSVDHNYNWFDPAGICGNGSSGPCDNVGHGTHTMGTMVGDDGAENQIGVAPGAKWIAAKGCEYNSCTTESLLASAEWILAPTDLSGGNPRPDLRPNIVNNSWGGGSGDPFFQEAVQAWVAAGIFPAFSAGNSGSSCGSANSPGDYPESYASGAYDVNQEIAYFSSRGPAYDGSIKPNIAAPGVDVRSSVPGGFYEYYSGTSMASPHLAGTVALMWAAAPALIGDIVGTRALLDQSAVDTDDLSCGGDVSNNNVWGEGRLDAFVAVDISPRGPTGTIEGVVTAASSGEPLVGVQVTAHALEGRDRVTSTDASGHYQLRLPIGFYDVSVRAFAYLSQSADGLEVTEGNLTSQAFALEAAPSFAVRGTVVDDNGDPIAYATATIPGTPIAPVQTDANGEFVFASVPVGNYQLGVAGGRCYDAQSQALDVVDADVELDFTLGARFDSYGYSCAPAAYEYLQAEDIVTQYGNDESFAITLPFPVTFYGKTYETANMSVNGVLSFEPGAPYGWNTPIPSSYEPNGAIYALWDDFFVYSGGSMRTSTFGTAPNRVFVVEWRDMEVWYDYTARVSFEIILHESGAITLQYAGDDAFSNGSSATIGIENADGTVGLQYSSDEASVGSTTSFTYSLPPSGIVSGVVTDANDGLPVAGASVRALSGGVQARAARTDASGRYQLQVPVGAYDMEATTGSYESQVVSLNVAENAVLTQNFALRSARATVTPPTLQLVAAANQTRRRQIVLGNTGSVPLQYEIAEAGGRRQTTTASRTLTRVAGFDPGALNTRGMYTQSTPVAGWTPNAVGDVLASFTPTGMTLAWGVGYSGGVWLSDPPQRVNTEFAVDGTPTGRSWETSWAPGYPGDMALETGRDLMCQLDIEGDNGIHCFDQNTGSEVDSITGSFPWTMISQRGLAYREDDDTFYVGGWNEGVIYHVKGLSHSDKGAVIETCMPPDSGIAGLAWNGSAGVLWAATNSSTDTIYELNPQDCTVLSTLAHPTPGYNGGGLEMDNAGNLWMIGQNPNVVYLIDSGVPAYADVSWLSVNPTQGSVQPGASQALDVTIDTTGLTPGIYLASIFVRSNSGREGAIRIPVSLVVSAYLQAANAGGDGYTDSLGDRWHGDKKYAAGSWGWVQKGTVNTVTRAIAGTLDPTLYRSQRIDPYAYRYDNVPNGIYEIDLRFAEHQFGKPAKRLFDVIVENTTVLPAHDIVYEVGRYAADDQKFFVEVTDGRLDVRFIPRAGFDKPVINALRVTHRPDR